MLKKLLSIAGFATALVSAQGTGFPEDDRVRELWQQPNITFGLFSGYLNTTSPGDKLIHYVGALSKNNPLTDPVIVWFNGGPGCSAMIAYSMSHGPYIFQDQSMNLT